MLQSGGGTEVRMHKIMAERMEKRDLFTSICRNARLDIDRCFKSTSEKLLAHVKTVCDAIRQNFDILKNAEAEVLRTTSIQKN